jgi:manganese-transporting P-type ATPase
MVILQISNYPLSPIAQSTGYYTLMCGDGTNDVGALKHAHVGVSILSNAPLKHPSERKREEKAARELANANAPITTLSTTSPPSAPTNNRQHIANRVQERDALTPRERAIRKNRENLQATQDKLQKALKEIEDEQVQIVKLGDASIAAPFTSKLSSIQCGEWEFMRV